MSGGGVGFRGLELEIMPANSPDNTYYFSVVVPVLSEEKDGAK